MRSLAPASCAGLVLGFALLCPLTSGVAPPARASETPTRTAPAEALCQVCREPVGEGGIALEHAGRTVALCSGPCEHAWATDPDLHFSHSQARGALFDEKSLERQQRGVGWLAFGLYVLIGLVVGAVCAYLAVGRGHPAALWFFLGLGMNVLALGVLLTRGRADTSDLPEGVPRGLSKVPTTRAPRPCPSCGHGNHPAAGRCSGCGGALSAVVVAETARI